LCSLVDDTQLLHSLWMTYLADEQKNCSESTKRFYLDTCRKITQRGTMAGCFTVVACLELFGQFSELLSECGSFHCNVTHVMKAFW